MRFPLALILALAGGLALSSAPALASADRDAYFHSWDHHRWEHYRHERERARERWREEHSYCHWLSNGYRSWRVCD